ncbi:hypothetical protein CRG98_031680, partial [Punica granatum]
AYNDKSRDYTIPAPSMASARLSGVPAASTAWQTPQAASVYSSAGFTAAALVGPAQVPTSWAQGSFPASAGPTQMGFQPNLRPGGASPPGMPPYYG